MEPTIGAGMSCGGAAASKTSLTAGYKARHIFYAECFDKHGNFKWADVAYNTVVNTGLDDILNRYYKGSSYTAAHYVGLTSTAPTPAAGDTMASHAGWTEFQTYTTASPNVRPTLTLGSVASQSVDNSASKASYTINTASPDSQTIGGAFLTTDSEIGGTAGTLIAVAAFGAGDKVLNGGDTLNVTVTCTAASA